MRHLVYHSSLTSLVNPLKTHSLPSFNKLLTIPALTRGHPQVSLLPSSPLLSHSAQTGDKHFLQLANTSNGRGAGVSPGPDVPTLFTYLSSHQFTFGRKSQFHNINLVTFSMDAKKANLVPQMKQAPDYIARGTTRIQVHQGSRFVAHRCRTSFECVRPHEDATMAF